MKKINHHSTTESEAPENDGLHPQKKNEREKEGGRE